MQYPNDLQCDTDPRLTGRDGRSVRDEPPVDYDPPMHEPWCCCPHGRRSLTVEHWRCVLVDEFGCDRHAMQKLLLLSQLEPAGHREAIKIIAKVKNYQMTYNKSLNNVSSYVTTNVQNAWNALTPEGRIYANNGTGNSSSQW